jgi:transaldolase
MSRMKATIAAGVEFWNDSCVPAELADAVEHGAAGATSNPVIVYTAIKADPKTWTPVVDGLIAARPRAIEDEIAWALIEALGVKAAAILAPVHKATRGGKGFLSMQVNPKLYPDSERMVEHGRILAGVAPNVAIKVPATAAGIKAAEELVAAGINVNATVSFTVSQAVEVAEAFERGLDRARARGADMHALHPYATLMLGRLDDHLQRVMTKEGIAVDPGLISRAGIAVFKRAREVFRERGYRATLLAAAYRHHLHWSELIGPGIVQSIPYAWWKQFEASDIEVQPTLDRPLDPAVVETLSRRFEDFRRAYGVGTLATEDFAHFGPTIHTLNQFIGGYQDLLGLVRERMLR